MQDTWDLADIYKSPEDDCLNSDRNALGSLVSEFRGSYQENLSLLNLKDAVFSYEKIIGILEKISSYSFLHLQTRLNDQKALSFYQKITEWLCDVNSKIVFFFNDISRLNEEEVKEFLEKDKDLNKYKSWILNCFKYKKHLLPHAAEEVLVQKFITSNSSWIRMYDEILAGLKFKFRNEEKSLPEILEIANHSDDSIERAETSRIISERLYEENFYIKHVYNNILLDRAIENRLRNYPKPESFRHLDNNIDQQSVDYLTDAVIEGYNETSHKYYKLKAKIFRKEKLEYWDRNIPPKFSSILKKTFNYNTGKELVLETFGSFSTVFYDIALNFLNKRWIDVYPVTGKTSGAFSHGCSCEIHPYILLNYFNTIRDVSTLAHELGHGIHQTLSARNGPLLAETPITLSEVASLFSEKLLFEKIFETAQTREEKIDLLCWKIDDTINSTMRQIAFFKFEKKVHELRLSKELSTEDLSNAFLETQRECLGDSVNVDSCIGIYWTYISHFFHSPFYVYAYAFGEIFVNALYMNYKETGNRFVDKYINMLSKGGIEKYDAVARNFGLDPTQQDFWADGIVLIERQIEHLEKLYDSKVCN